MPSKRGANWGVILASTPMRPSGAQLFQRQSFGRDDRNDLVDRGLFENVLDQVLGTEQHQLRALELQRAGARNEQTTSRSPHRDRPPRPRP
jgi:hypothetical protein